MDFFLDSADLTEIAEVCKRGFARGLTTNPTVLARQGDISAVGHLRRIVDLVRDHDDSWPVSVQVMTLKPSEMIRQAELLAESLSYKNLVVKIPCSWDSLEVISSLSRQKITVNCTACITTTQAALAAASGARYVSMFLGKMTDAGLDAVNVISRTARLLGDHGVRLIVGSIRRPYDITEIAWSGAHIATVPYPYFERIATHEKTGEAVRTFAENFMPLDLLPGPSSRWATGPGTRCPGPVTPRRGASTDAPSGAIQITE